MKKVLSIVLSICIMAEIIYPCQSAFAEEALKNSVEKVSVELAEICEKYDKKYSEKEEIVEIKERLIVKTDKPIEEYGAVESVYGSNYAFLQYRNSDEAERAYNEYTSQGYILSYDSTIKTLAYDSDDAQWSSYMTDATGAMDFYKLKIKPRVTVAIFDTGIDYNHPSLKNRCERTYANLAPTGSYDDEMDYNGHGTQIAGIIEQCTPTNVKIQGYKVVTSDGTGTTSLFVEALEYIALLEKKPDILNISLEFPFEPTSIIDDAISVLIKDGVNVILAAGNNGREINTSLFNYNKTIKVAAVDKESTPCSFSNYGAGVDISAPGNYVATYTATRAGGGIVRRSGTSYAAAFVSAAAAIVLTEHNDYTNEQVKRELIETAIPFKKSDCYKGYGAGIVNFSNTITQTRCKNVTANYPRGVYNDDIKVELKCDNSLVNIKYTTDGTLPSESNGTVYSKPIELTQSTRIIAAAFAKVGTTFHSKYASFDYNILKNGKSEYIIDENGKIINYLGNEKDIIVADEIDGITPTEIGEKCFAYTDTQSIVLPDSIKVIGDEAFQYSNLKSIKADGAEKLGEYAFQNSELQEVDFPNVNNLRHSFEDTPIVSASLPNIESIIGGFRNCKNLKDIEISNIKYIYENPFDGCDELTMDLKLDKCVKAEKAFVNSSFRSIFLSVCETVRLRCFEGAKADTVRLGGVTLLDNYNFTDCPNLKLVSLPLVTKIGDNAFADCPSLETIFAPMVIKFNPSIGNKMTVYVNDAWQSMGYSSSNELTLVACENTLASKSAEKYNYKFKISSDMVHLKGASIRVNNPGLRFGFDWDEFSLLEDIAESVEYGFVYTYSETDNLRIVRKDTTNINTAKIKEAVNTTVNGKNTSFNLVFTNIPAANYDSIVSVRAYVCIDGMYFYSPIIQRSFSQVANAVIADEDIDDEVKNSVRNLLNKGV